MRDIRSDWYEPRELNEPGPRLVVICEAEGCDRAALLSPRPLFGARRFWPAEGPSQRFRCACGSRRSKISYTINAAQKDGPVSRAVIRLWL